MGKPQWIVSQAGRCGHTSPGFTVHNLISHLFYQQEMQYVCLPPANHTCFGFTQFKDDLSRVSKQRRATVVITSSCHRVSLLETRPMQSCAGPGPLKFLAGIDIPTRAAVVLRGRRKPSLPANPGQGSHAWTPMLAALTVWFCQFPQRDWNSPNWSQD